jgi:hypothetical protein
MNIPVLRSDWHQVPQTFQSVAIVNILDILFVCSCARTSRAALHI